MIKALIFDLDGTLIQTEVLKARSYALAIEELTKNSVSLDEVLNVFGKYVGLSRNDVLQGLYNEFTALLEKYLNTKDAEEIKTIIIEKRLKCYHQMLDDPELLSKHFCSHTLQLFHLAKERNFTVVLATMSHLAEAKRITSIMGIFDQFDLVCTKDNVTHGKPDPEIYHKVSDALQLKANQCLVIEDSVNGIKAAQNAQMPVFAVTNSVTRKSVHECNLLKDEFVVDNLTQLSDRVFAFIEAQKASS